MKVAQERSKGPGARRNAASQFSSYDSAHSSEKGQQSPADDLLQLPKSSEITFSTREKTQILTKLKEEYQERQESAIIRKKYNKGTPTVKNTKDDIKQFIKDSHGKNGDYRFDEVKRYLKNVTDKLLHDPKRAEDKKSIMKEVTERLAPPNGMMDHMLNELEDNMRQRKRTSQRALLEDAKRRIPKTRRSTTASDA